MRPRPHESTRPDTLFPYTTLFRSGSPLIAVTDTNDVVVRTAQVRLKVDTRIATPLASVHVPLLAELGSASARITDIDCAPNRSEEHTSELQSLMRISYAVFCLKKKNNVQKFTIDRVQSYLIY